MSGVFFFFVFGDICEDVKERDSSKDRWADAEESRSLEGGLASVSAIIWRIGQY